MTKDESAKVLAVVYVYDTNTFRRSERLRKDMADIRVDYRFADGKSDDKEFNELFDRYCRQLEKNGRDNPPRWAKLIMAERYALNI